MLIILVLSFGFSGMFTIIAKSSFIYIEHFDISTELFPLFFGFNILILIVMIRINIKLLNSYSADYLVRYALIFQLLIALLFILNAKNISLEMSMFFLAAYMGSNGFIYGNCTALALENFSKNAGVASSVIGVIQFGLGALVSSMVLLFHSPNLTPIAISLFMISLCAYGFMYLYKNK